MREIKFRAWNKETNTMIFPEDSICCFELSDTGLNVLDMTDDLGFAHIDAAIMQYTGVKDKNGVEIYEGDIVKVHFEQGDSTYITDVYWGGEDYPAFDLNTRYMPEIYFDSNIFSFMKFTNEFTVEVIGNIYENPKLLDGGSEK